MKYFFIIGFILSTILGFWPGGVARPKAAWWRWLAVISLLVAFVLGFGIPMGGTFGSIKTIAMGRGDSAVVPLAGEVLTVSAGDSSAATLKDANGETQRILLSGSGISPEELKVGENAIIDVNFDRAGRAFHAHRLVWNNPPLMLPLIPLLEERSRNLVFHVPTAWVSQLAWFVAFGFAVAYLRTRRMEHDILASSAAALGAVFCILATTTGAVWARFNWGVFWNWDPRQTSIAVVLVIYGAYFALRSALDNEDQRAKISSIYLIVLLVPVLFFMFVLPRLSTESLHPGSKTDVNSGPVLSSQSDSLNPLMGILYGTSLFGFIMLFFWMLNVVVRTRFIELRRRRQAAALHERTSAPAELAMDQEVVRLR
jgi:heme exporter protein C